MIIKVFVTFVSKLFARP